MAMQTTDISFMREQHFCEAKIVEKSIADSPRLFVAKVHRPDDARPGLSIDYTNLGAHMFKQYIGWKFVLVSMAVVIIVATIWFVSSLSQRIQEEETKKVATWVEANRELLQAPADANLNLAVEIVTNNSTIPLILTDEKGAIIDSRNLDSTKIVRDQGYLRSELASFKKKHPPFIMEIDAKQKIYYYIYYGDSLILKQVRYYPYIQLLVVTLFIVVVLFALSSTNRATQNLVWVGLAKETAHQLGTPLSSMEAWLELLKETEGNESVVTELGKDVDRLKLITDRFSKIGSVPKLEEKNIVEQIEHMTAYIRKRAPQRVQFTVHAGDPEIPAMISPPCLTGWWRTCSKTPWTPWKAKAPLTSL